MFCGVSAHQQVKYHYFMSIYSYIYMEGYSFFSWIELIIRIKTIIDETIEN